MRENKIIFSVNLRANLNQPKKWTLFNWQSVKQKKKETSYSNNNRHYFSINPNKKHKKEKKNLPRVCCHFFLWFSFYFFLHLRTFIFLSSTFRNLRARPTSNYQVISRPFCIIFHIYQTSCECNWKKKFQGKRKWKKTRKQIWIQPFFLLRQLQ